MSVYKLLVQSCVVLWIEILDLTKLIMFNTYIINTFGPSAWFICTLKSCSKQALSRYFCATSQLHNSPGDFARELFKPSKVVASLPACIEKNWKVLDFIFLRPKRGKYEKIPPNWSTHCMIFIWQVHFNDFLIFIIVFRYNNYLSNKRFWLGYLHVFLQVEKFKDDITKEAEKLINDFFPRKCIELDELLKVCLTCVQFWIFAWI